MTTTPALTQPDNPQAALPAPHPTAPFRAAWIVLCIVCAGVYLLALPARHATLSRVQGDDPATYQLSGAEADLLAEYSVGLEVYASYLLFFEVIQAGAFVAVAVWLFARRSDQVAVIVYSFTLLLIGVIGPATVSALRADPSFGAALVVLDVLRLISTVIFIYTFPDGRFVPRWTALTALLWTLGIVALFAVAGEIPGWPPLIQGLVTLLWLGPGLGAQLYRYRRVSTPEQRLQTRWFVFGMTVVLGTAVLRGLLGALIPALVEPGPLRLLYWTLVVVPIFDTVCFIVLPLSIGVSIARHGLYGLNLVINRWLVYGGVIGLLGFCFFLAFFLLQGAVQLLGGPPALALVIATALCVSLFNPARRALQRFVDRRFFGLRLPLNRLDADRRAREAQAGAPGDGSLAERTLGVYKLGELIGKGGMGMVYHAQHRALGQPVAVKVLSESLADDPHFRARFEQEAKVVAALRHPNIVRMFDLGVDEADDRPPVYYMAMEYIAGQDLSERLREAGRLPLIEAARIISDLADALDYAHTQGLVHRDVKPSNVILRQEDGSAVLMDFGIAKLMHSRTSLTGSILMGTLDYAAPEQIMSAPALDGRADIYALGVMSYQMLVGALPFSGGVGQVVFAHLEHPAPDPHAVVPDLPEHAARAVMRAMAKQPHERFQTAVAFARALAAEPQATN